MAQSVVTRTQRRMERKQVVWLLVLTLGVAIACFALGYLIGQRNKPVPALAMQNEKPESPPAAQAAVPPRPVAEAATVPQKLTFYDNLPKGSQAPLGSGINLPPEPEPPAPEKTVLKTAAPKPEPAPVPVEAIAVPRPAPGGAFVLQVASFRTEQDASKLSVRLQKLTSGVFVERADLGDKGIWFRVMAGPYNEREAADQVAGRLLAEERISALVRKR